jgi:regulator of protease activity HflC (stomatin/prohibitin superfamily)
METALVVSLLVFIFVVNNMFIVVSERHKVIQERLGKYSDTLGAGFHFMIPFVDRAAYMQEMREQVLDVPSQSCITRDNIKVAVDGLVYIKVVDAERASYGIADYRNASVNLAQTTMRSEIGKMDLDTTFSERDTLNRNIVNEIDVASDNWGIKVLRYEIKDIEPSRHIMDTMEQQMEAERQKRSDITLSDGQKTAKILISEGDQIEAVNLSEAEKQKRINEAQGKAQQIGLVAEATAQGVREVAAAIGEPQGAMAVKVQLAEQFIDNYGDILKQAQVSVLPANIADLKSVVESLKLPLYQPKVGG